MQVWIVTTGLVWLLSTTAAMGADSWGALDTPGFREASGRMVKTTVATFDLHETTIRIVSVPFQASSGPIGSETSLRTLAVRLAGQPSHRNREWVVVNGGFSSYRTDVPLGLLIVDRRVYSTVATEKARTGPGGSEFAGFRWSGILCQATESSEWDILPVPKYRAGLCKQALQAGPVPVEPDGVLGISAAEASRSGAYRRTAICLTRDRKVKVVLTLDETHLYPLAEWLSKPEAAGGLGCRVALNLSGDTSSGLAMKPSAVEPLTFVGDGSFPIPTALIFERRAAKR